MAASYKNLAQAQAAYDTIEKQKQRMQRNDFINRKQNEMAVNNYLKQNGYNGGRAETFFLRNLGNQNAYESYDAQLADLAAIIKGFRGRGRGGSVYTPVPEDPVRTSRGTSSSTREHFRTGARLFANHTKN